MKMPKAQFIILLKSTFEELLINQVDLINSEEAREYDKNMLVALFQIFDTILKSSDVIDSLYESNATYDEIEEYINKQYRNYN